MAAFSANAAAATASLPPLPPSTAHWRVAKLPIAEIRMQLTAFGLRTHSTKQIMVAHLNAHLHADTARTTRIIPRQQGLLGSRIGSTAAPLKRNRATGGAAHDDTATGDYAREPYDPSSTAKHTALHRNHGAVPGHGHPPLRHPNDPAMSHHVSLFSPRLTASSPSPSRSMSSYRRFR